MKCQPAGFYIEVHMTMPLGNVNKTGHAMITTKIVSLSLVTVFLLLIAACGNRSTTDAVLQGSLVSTDIQLNSDMKEKLLELADDRDRWFLVSDITSEALEGLYNTWSVICQNDTSLSDYKKAVYEVVRPWVLEETNTDLKGLQKAGRYYTVESWSPPWASVKQTWKDDANIILGPQLQLYLIESGEWRYHDC